MIKFFLILITRICCGIIVRHESEDYQKKNIVFFANHTSHLDLLVLLSALPKKVRDSIRPVAAREYWGAHVLRRFIARVILHAIWVDLVHPQHAKDTFRHIHEALEQGDSILIFPEGTRHSEHETPPFHSGIYLIAKMRPDTLFVPVYLKGFNRALPKGEWVPAPNMGEITFRSALRLSEGETKESFVTRCREALYNYIQENEYD